MKTEFTPGPWRVVIDDDGNPLSGRPSVQAADEYDCAIVHWDGFVQTYWRSARGDKEIHANASLIAASPDLLEALQGMLRVFMPFPRPDTEGWREEHEACETARAAITRATGQSS